MVKPNVGFHQVLGSEVAVKEKILPNENVKSAAMTEEAQFLSLLLHHQDLVEDVVSNSMIDVDYFYVERNGLMFGIIMLAFQKYGGLLTDSALEEYTRNSPTAVDERVFYDKIFRIRAKREDYQRLKKNITSRYVQQRFYELCWVGEGDKEGLVNQILNANDNQVELISSLQDKLLDLGSQFNKDSVSRVSPLSDVLDRVMIDITNRRKDPGANWGWLTGFSGIDNVIYGLRPGEYGIIVGYPNGGKTTVMLNLALGMSMEHEFRKVVKKGARVCYVTVESDDAEITERLLCNWAKISSSTLKEGGDLITNEFYDRILKAKTRMQEEIGDTFTIVNVTQGIPVTDLLALIDAKRRVVGFDVVFVDYLDVISSVRKYEGRPDLETGEVSVMLQAYAKKHNLVMITAQSFNNEMIKAIKKQQLSIKQDDHEKSEVDKVSTVIGLEGIGGTQKLSRDADFVWGLMLGSNGTKLSVYWLKSRKSGKPGPFTLDAALDYCILSEPSESFVLDGDELAEALHDPEKIREQSLEKQKNSLKNAGLIENASKDPRVEFDPSEATINAVNNLFEAGRSSVNLESDSGKPDNKKTDIHPG